jgi:MoaA/NifB/PqqE/SkfB family radical SAM enzyme
VAVVADFTDRIDLSVFFLQTRIAYLIAAVSAFCAFFELRLRSSGRFFCFLRKEAEARVIASHLLRLFRKNGLPIHLVYHCTYRCNSRCKNCFLRDYLLPEESRTPEGRVELELGELERLRNSLGNILWLQIGGGEPFLREDIVEICKIFRKTDTITISTNCINSELIGRKVKEILENIDSKLLLALSLDGIGDNHDALRGTKGNFDAVLDTYRRVEGLRNAHNNFSVSINTVIMPENEKELSSIADYARTNLHLDMHSFEFMRGKPSPAFPDLMNFQSISDSFSTARKTIDYYDYKKGWRGRLLKKAKLYEHDLLVKTMRDRRKQIDCYAGRMSVTMNPYGDVFACELVNDSIGNIRDYDYDFEKLWLSKKAQEIKHKLKDCFCAHSCFYLINSLFNPVLTPDILAK